MTPNTAVFRQIFKECLRVTKNTYDYLPNANTKYPFVYIGESSNTPNNNSEMMGMIRQTIHVYGELKKRSEIDDIVANLHDKIISLTSAYGYNIQIDRINEQTLPDNSDTTPLLHTVLDVYLTYTKKENKWLN
ncbi:TPA: hypothetical protein VB744_001426 [Streptococcus pyogenes]|uniref:hypothetical protein n=1 Tax=Streptococcus pyogenes TaxID=1314 RepID=UPI000254D609|nr:hypothetical protein [Streptococcus pyogenes]AUG50488.1 hypothetical protein CCX85_05020 [Streptococcus pyogenes]PWO34014.1 hypothetical protein DJ561_04255 [Streptococcus pyogenes]RXS70342.1 hypothetical protein ER615_00900 [Streptococcus pyogenes]CCG26551.1 hypothetical protein [Streptococcus pyogenes NS88.2]VGQ89627.1 phage protein [Streptococcus pyogenes]